MGIDIDIAIGDFRKLKKLPDQVRNVLLDTDPILDDLHEWALDYLDKQFRSQGAHGGDPWARYGNEPDYKDWKEGILGSATPVMRWKGGNEVLYPSLTDADHPKHVADTEDMSIEVGTEVPYAQRLAETGGTNPFGETYPARPIFVIGERHENRAKSFVTRGLEERFEDELEGR